MVTPVSLTFGIADSRNRARAVALQRAVYFEELGAAPQDAAGDDIHYLVATADDDRLVGTCRIVGPGGRPFEIERFVDLGRVGASGPVLALAGRLCLDRGYRSVSRSLNVLSGLLRCVAEIAQEQQWTDLIIYPRSSLVAFYRGAKFRETGLRFVDPRFGLEMHVMHAAVSDLVRRVAAMSLGRKG